MDCGCLSKDICICEVVINENNLWCQICKQFEDEKDLIRKYLSRNDKNTDLPSHPVAGYLDSDIISLLKDALLSVLQETENQNCLDRRRSSYDPIDHFAQFLWVHNTRYPERIDKYDNIHDMEWVQKYLRQNPRSFFPFHLVWNENFAAIKIQSYMRGYWVRKQENIQEVRKFWKPEVRKYADVLIDKSQPDVIIKPRENDQSSVQTKSNFLRNLNLATENLQMTKIKSVKDEGIEWQAETDNAKLRKTVEDELADLYETNEVSRIHPCLSVVEDPLNYLLVHHYLLVNHKIISPINYFSCTITSILTTIASLNFISNEGLGNFVKNNAFAIAGTFIVALNIVLEYFVMRKLHNHLKLELYWDIDTASLPRRHEIVKEIREEYKIYLAITIITILAAFFNFMLENFTDIYIFCDTVFVEEILTGYRTTKIIIKFILSLTHFCGILTVISQILGMKYGAGTLKIQLYLLIDYLNQIEIYHSEEQKIKAHLEICSKHHIFLTGYRNEILELSPYSILFLPFSIMVLAVGFVLYIYYNNDLVISLYMSLLSILLLLFVIEICKSGQDVQNAFEDFYWEVTKVAWCDWSERNKKALLLMMTRCQKVEVYGALTVEINKSLLIKITKMVYQGFLVIQQTLN